jgi:hypothetical protein
VNTAFNVRLPTGSDVVVVEAAPPLTVTGLPMSVVPFSNCTDPAAGDEVEGVTLTAALSCTDAPAVAWVVGLVVSVVVVATWTSNGVLPDDALSPFPPDVASGVKTAYS